MSRQQDCLNADAVEKWLFECGALFGRRGGLNPGMFKSDVK